MKLAKKKLTEEEKKQIIQMYNNVVSIPDICKVFNLTRIQVINILKKQTNQ